MALEAMVMEFVAMDRSLDAALARVDRCDEMYRSGNRRIRRDLCFAFFERIYISAEGVAGSDLVVPTPRCLGGPGGPAGRRAGGDRGRAVHGVRSVDPLARRES